MSRLAALAVAFVLVAAGCGEDRSPAEQALADAEAGLERIESGELTMELLASPAGSGDGRGVGFRLEGPFQVGEKKGDLPVADLEFTRITGGERRTTGFVSTGEKAFVELDGIYTQLDNAQVEELRVTGDAKGGGLDGLSLDEWVAEPTVSTGPRVGGVATRRITGAVDAVPAINDLLELAGGFGAADEDAPTRLEGEGADAVRRAVESAKVDLLVGAEDDLLRKLELVIDLSVQGESSEVRRALKGLAGARLAFQLDVGDVNRPVTVDAPDNARPAP
ncbi:MAG: hypothetical protein QOG87_2574 [Actinomycetota bacterium]